VSDGKPLAHPTGMSTLAVVVSHWRQTKFLRACLESLRAQTRVPDEVILIDSFPEATAAVVSEFTDLVTHVIVPARGAAAARNAGAALSHSDLLSFIDADTVATPDRCERQVAALDTTDALLVHGATHLIDARGRRRTAEPYRSEQVPFEHQLGWLLERNRIATDTVCIRRAALNLVGGFCERERVQDDYDLWLRLSTAGRFHYLVAPLAEQRRHDPAGAQDHAAACEAGALRRVDDAAARAAFERTIADAEEREIVFGELLLRREEPDRAAAHFIAALRHRPQATGLLFHIASFAMDAGESGAAERLLRQALVAAPFNAAIWNNLGVALALGHKRAEARSAFFRAVCLMPHGGDARYNLELIRGERIVDDWAITRRRPRATPVADELTQAA